MSNPGRKDGPEDAREEQAKAAGDEASPEPEGVGGNAGPEDAPEEPVEATGEDPGALAEEQDAPPAGEEDGGPEGDAEDGAPDDGAGEAEVAALSAALERVERERDEYLEALKRLKAEFENARKRQERERTRVLEAASEKLVAELLPVLDNLDRALESEGDIRGGVRATRDQLVGVLEGEGLLPVASDGQPFDPNVHEAVMSRPSDEHEEGTVLQTFQRGYLLNGRPIRPAKVVVSQQG